MQLNDLLRASIDGLMRELVDGPPSAAAYVLNPGDPGFLRSLNGLSAREASARPNGRSSTAAHVRHLHYGFELLNRWAQGETPFDDADYAGRWAHQEVSDGDWRDLLAALEREMRLWMSYAIAPRDTWDGTVLSAVLGSVAHLAYHLGAIRQVSAAASGPAAAD